MKFMTSGEGRGLAEFKQRSVQVRFCKEECQRLKRLKFQSKPEGDLLRSGSLKIGKHLADAELSKKNLGKPLICFQYSHCQFSLSLLVSAPALFSVVSRAVGVTEL
jgi:hypothetical protein